MAIFSISIDKVIEAEGGLSNNPNDKGGLTNFGITQKFLDSINDPKFKNVAELTKEDAKIIYLQYFWHPNSMHRINSQKIANKLFLMIINMNPNTAIEMFQEACNEIYMAHVKMLKSVISGTLAIDGILGPKTFYMANMLPDGELLKKMSEILIKYYTRIADKDESQKGFLRGWINRANME